MSQSVVNRKLIHPTAILQGEIELGEDVSIGAYTVLTGPLTIQSGCVIGSHCVLGGDPEHRVLSGAGSIEIGTGTVIRDSVIIHHGTAPNGTRIGSNCYIMSRVYIAHDCQIDDGVTIAAGSSIGGHVHLQEGSNLGMNVAVHQYSTVGAYSMVGMSTPVTKDIPPLAVVAGNPMRLLHANDIGIDRAGLKIGDLEIAESALTYDRSAAKAVELIERFQASSRRNCLFEVRYSDHVPRKPR